VSHLTQALRGSSRNKDQLPSTAAHSNGQQQQQQQRQPYSSQDYEERCEGVLTKVYSSCFKVKDHVALAESEVGVGEGGVWFAGVVAGLSVYICR
jgi:hypothetical protein